MNNEKLLQRIAIDPAGLPRELQRRLLLVAFDRLAAPRPRGPDLDRALHALTAGKSATLSGLKLTGGEMWRVVRPGTGPVNGHVSETALDTYTYDNIIDNAGTVDDLRCLLAHPWA